MRLTVAVFYLALVYSGCSVKHDLQPKSSRMEPPVVDENWMRVTEEYITFSIPKSLEKEDFVPIDTPNYVYSSETLTVDISIGVNAPSISYFREHFSFVDFKEKKVELRGDSGAQADIHFAKGSALFAYPDRVFAKVIEVPCPSEHFRVSFLILYTEKKYEETARKIVDSITIECPEGGF